MAAEVRVLAIYEKVQIFPFSISVKYIIFLRVDIWINMSSIYSKDSIQGHEVGPFRAEKSTLSKSRHL